MDFEHAVFHTLKEILETLKTISDTLDGLDDSVSYLGAEPDQPDEIRTLGFTNEERW